METLISTAYNPTLSDDPSTKMRQHNFWKSYITQAIWFLKFMSTTLINGIKKYFFQLNEPYIPAKHLQISFAFSLSASIYQVNIKLLIPVTLFIPEFIK